MLMKSETTLPIIILSFVTIVSSSTPISDSRPHSRRLLGSGPTNFMWKIGTNRRSRAMPRTIETSPPIDRSARRIFFWPWYPRWHRHRWWHRRPFRFGAGIYGGIGIGIGPGGGMGFHRPFRLSSFGDISEIGMGPGAGIVPSPPISSQYQPEASLTISDSNGAYSDPERQPINYPDLPPIPNDFNGQPPIPSNGADFSGPSAVGFDDGTDHSVGYDRAVRKPVRYKKQGYLKHDPGSHKSVVNIDIDRGAKQQNGSHMTIDDTNKKRVLQWLRDRHKNVVTDQSDYEGDRNYSKGPETNSYGRDYQAEEHEAYYDEDRYHDYPAVEQLFTDLDLAHGNDAV